MARRRHAAGVQVAGKMGFGGVCGFCAGYAVQCVTRVVAVTLGLIFILLQVGPSTDEVVGGGGGGASRGIRIPPHRR